MNKKKKKRKRKEKKEDFSTILTILMDLAYPKGLKPIIDMHKILRTNKIEVISSKLQSIIIRL